MARHRKGKLGIETILPPMQSASLYMFLYLATHCFGNKSNDSKLKLHDKIKKENSQNL